MRLLLIDQASTGADLLARKLGGLGFRPLVLRSAQEALSSRLRDGAAALVLDQGLEAPPAAQSVTQLRRGGLEQPLLVLSARDDWRERVASFDAGADDFLLKPVHSEEVHARLRAVIRRSVGASTDRLVLGDLDIDLKGQCAWRAGQCLNLTRNEFRLLRLLLLAPGNQASKAEIARAVWPEHSEPRDNVIEVLVGRLRGKLGTDRIHTVRGLGYRFAVPAASQDESSPHADCLAVR